MFMRIINKHKHKHNHKCTKILYLIGFRIGMKRITT